MDMLIAPQISIALKLNIMGVYNQGELHVTNEIKTTAIQTKGFYVA